MIKRAYFTHSAEEKLRANELISAIAENGTNTDPEIIEELAELMMRFMLYRAERREARHGPGRFLNAGDLVGKAFIETVEAIKRGSINDLSRFQVFLSTKIAGTNNSRQHAYISDVNELEDMKPSSDHPDPEKLKQVIDSVGSLSFMERSVLIEHYIGGRNFMEIAKTNHPKSNNNRAEAARYGQIAARAITKLSDYARRNKAEDLDELLELLDMNKPGKAR